MAGLPAYERRLCSGEIRHPSTLTLSYIMANVPGLEDLLKNWRIPELLWLVMATVSVLIISLALGESPMGIVSALSGIICVVLTAKGKLAAYYFGVINCVLYGIISYTQTLYGEFILNFFYYLPLQFIGFRIWLRHMDASQASVQSVRLSAIQRLYWLVGLGAGTALLGWGLSIWGDALPYVDAYTTVASVLAMTLSARRNAEQWYLWISINLFTIYMWTERFSATGENIATLMMWIVYLLNSFYGLFRWTRK